MTRPTLENFPGKPLPELLFPFLFKKPEEAGGIVESLQALGRQCTTAFKHDPNWSAPFHINIPVAALQESAYIGHTLAEFARQPSYPPHRVLLYANFPASQMELPEATAKVQSTIRTIVDTMNKYDTTFPCGMIVRTPEDPSIGQLRQHAADVSLSLNAAPIEDPPKDGLTLNHDADLISLNPTYLADIWDVFVEGQGQVKVVSSDVRHASSTELPEAHPLPHMDAVVAWFDQMTTRSDGYYDVGNAISIQAYVESGGYNPRMLGGETLELIRRVQRGARLGHPAWRRAHKAKMVTSPRRLFYKLDQGIGPQEFWVRGDFTPNDPYRERPLSEIADITPDFRDRAIHEIIQVRTKYIAAKIHRDYPEMDYPDVMIRTHQILHLTRAAIGAPAQLP